MAVTRATENLSASFAVPLKYDMVRQAAEEAGQVEAQNLNDIFSDLVKKKQEEFIERLKSGNLEPRYQIGASAYTVREWDKLMKTFDKIQEKLREEAGLEEKKVTVTKEEKEEEGAFSEDVSALFSEYLTGSWPDGEDDQKIYAVVADSNGIRCICEGKVIWEIPLNSREEYEKVVALMHEFGGMNCRFACAEEFWRDYLDDKLDMEAFREFLATRTKDGVPDYTDEDENGVRINRDAAQWARYMNRPGFVQKIEGEIKTSKPKW